MSSILNRIANYQHSLSTRQNKFRSVVGVVQFCATEDVERNFDKCARLIEECADKGAQMVCLPEHFAYTNQDNVASGGKSLQYKQDLNLELFLRYK